MNNKSFGVEYIFDAYGCDKDKLNSLDVCYEFLTQLPLLLKMTPQSLPTVFRTPQGPQFRNGEGITGFCGLLESSLVIHTMPTHNYAAINCFTCGSMNIDTVRGCIKQFFRYSNYEDKLIERGITYHNY